MLDPHPFTSGDEILEIRMMALFGGDPDPFPNTAAPDLEIRLQALFAGEPDPAPNTSGDTILEERLAAVRR